MSKIDVVRAAMVEAMKAKDKQRKDALSMLLSALKNFEIDKKDHEPITEDEANTVVKKEIKQYLHPRQIRKIRMDGRVVEHEVVRNVNVFMVVYIMIFATSVFILAFDNLDLITNFTAVAATFNNIGPGLELVGPTANFNVFSDVGKYVLIFDMLAGRLELFPLLIVFAKNTWSK